MPSDPKGRFLRERVQSPSRLKRAGFTRFRTLKLATGHRLVLAAKPGRRRKGSSRLQAILHPRGEEGRKFSCDSGVCRRIAMLEVEREVRREIGREL